MLFRCWYSSSAPVGHRWNKLFLTSDVPVAGTPWMISARWNPAPASGLQSRLDRIGAWTLLLMVAEAILAMIALICTYRRFMMRPDIWI